MIKFLLKMLQKYSKKKKGFQEDISRTHFAASSYKTASTIIGLWLEIGLYSMDSRVTALCTFKRRKCYGFLLAKKRDYNIEFEDEHFCYCYNCAPIVRRWRKVQFIQPTFNDFSLHSITFICNILKILYFWKQRHFLLPKPNQTLISLPKPNLIHLA